LTIKAQALNMTACISRRVKWNFFAIKNLDQQQIEENSRKKTPLT
jgi:hypothetical protein